MKAEKIVFLLLSTAIIFSCGNKRSQDIVVSELKGFCDCMEAFGIVGKEMRVLLKPYTTGTEAQKNKAIKEKLDKLLAKQTEINDKCSKELGFNKSDIRDCPDFAEFDQIMIEVENKLEQ